MSKSSKKTGRPTLYKKPHRTSVMLSSTTHEQLIPELMKMIGCSKADVIEKAIRVFHAVQSKQRNGPAKDGGRDDTYA